MKTIAWTLMIALTAILASASICPPYSLSDAGNDFFRALVFAFAAAFFVVMAKPWVGDGQHATAAMNSLSILIFLFSLAIMADLTMAIFRIPAIKKNT